VPDDPIITELEHHLQRNMLKWHVGHEIFCKSCGAVMDCKRAVEVDVMRGPDLLKSLVVCALCYDDARERMEAAAARQEGVRLVVQDGRVLFGKRASCRAPSKLKPGEDVPCQP
jgi:hypothetical protein